MRKALLALMLGGCGGSGAGVSDPGCEADAQSRASHCDPPAECTEGQIETRPCGGADRGRQSRRCVDGVWGDYEACTHEGECTEGAEESQPCGTAGRGRQSRRCVDGDWGDYEACVHDGECAAGAEESEPCGLNDRGRRTRRCEGGSWTGFGECDDPDECVDGEEIGPCEAGVGACLAEGSVVCVSGAPVCDAELRSPGPERCDGVDDDCNGEVDDRDCLDCVAMTWAPPTLEPAGATPRGLAVADLDGDGLLDVVLPNDLDGRITVRLGLGDGGLGEAIPHPAGRQPYAVTVADVDVDGALDVAVADYASAEVLLLLGRGGGAFEDGLTIPTGVQPIAIAASDFDGDGRPDLAIANAGSDTVRVVLSGGESGLGESRDYATGVSPRSVAFGDFNGDSAADLVLANWGSDDLTVLLGDGAGGFAEAPTVPAGSMPRAVALADLNGDGATDLVVANFGSDEVTTHLGAGDGSFERPAHYAAHRGPLDVAALDLNGDGSMDAVAANADGRELTVHMGREGGEFAPAVLLESGDGPIAVAAADMNGDGGQDLVAANHASGQLAVFLATCGECSPGSRRRDACGLNGRGERFLLCDAGRWGPPADCADPDECVDGDQAGPCAMGEGACAVEGDAICRGGAPVCEVQPLPPTPERCDGLDNDCNGAIDDRECSACDEVTWDAPVTAPSGETPRALVVTDLDGDGWLDVAIPNDAAGAVSVHLGLGDGRFAEPALFPSGSRPYAATAADLDGDGVLDLAVANYGDRNVALLIGRGDGAFDPGPEIPTGDRPISVAAEDLDGDGRVDLAMVHDGDPGLQVVLAQGDLQFADGQGYAVGDSPRWVDVGDVDGDGSPDLAVANWASGDVTVRLGDGDGTFGPASFVEAGDRPRVVEIGELNDDGIPDLVVANFGSEEVTTHLGIGDGHFAPARRFVAGAGPLALTLADVDADGATDALVANADGLDVTIHLGLGDGGLAPALRLESGAGPLGVAVADLNGDGAQDIATVNYGDEELAAFLGACGDCPLGEEEGEACGLNDRGERTRRCLRGGWGAFGECDDPDGCVDGVDLGPCEEGVGECRRQGVRRCVGGQEECDAVPAEPELEVCETGLDEDCDGVADEEDDCEVPCPACQGPNADGECRPAVVSVAFAGRVLEGERFQMNPEPETVPIAAGLSIVGSYGYDPLAGDEQDQALFGYHLSDLAEVGEQVPPEDDWQWSFGTYSVEATDTGGAHRYVVDYALTWSELFFVYERSVRIVLEDPTRTAFETFDLAAPLPPLERFASRTLVHRWATDSQDVMGDRRQVSSGEVTATVDRLDVIDIARWCPARCPELSVDDDGDRDCVADDQDPCPADPRFPAQEDADADCRADQSPREPVAWRCRVVAREERYPSTSWGGRALAAGDLTGDGVDDLVTGAGFEGLAVYPGAGDGTFGEGEPFGRGGNRGLWIADLDGDRLNDVVSLYVGDWAYVGVLHGVEDGPLRVGDPIFAPDVTTGLALLDLNADGRLDVAKASPWEGVFVGVEVNLGVEGGVVGPPARYDVPGARALAGGEFTSDDHVDIVVAGGQAGATSLYLLRGIGDGTVAEATLGAQLAGAAPDSLVVADFDGDGRSDVAGAAPNAGVIISRGLGDGTFELPVEYPAGGAASAIRLGDLNGDGRPDLVVVDLGADRAIVLAARPDGTFDEGRTYELGDGPQQVALADLDRDGDLDVVSANGDSDDLSVHLTVCEDP